MKKLLVLLAALAALGMAGAANVKPQQSAESPEAPKRVIVRTPSVSAMKRCFGEIAEAAAELAEGFSVEETPADPAASYDEYCFLIGEDAE